MHASASNTFVAFVFYSSIWITGRRYVVAHTITILMSISLKFVYYVVCERKEVQKTLRITNEYM